MRHSHHHTERTTTRPPAASPSRPAAGAPSRPLASVTPDATKSSPAKERRRAEFAQRQEERRRARERAQRQKRIKQVAALGGGVLAVGIVIWLIIFAVQANAPVPPIPGVVTYANLARSHVTTKVTYAQNPPVGGDHNPVWLNCGIYTTPVPNENAVRSLEHGSVWITYQPSLPASQVTQLANLVQGHDHAILSPYPGLPSPVVASAWGLQLKVASASDPRIAQFVRKYENGPQTPEAGAACSGGTGAPTT